MVPFLDYTCPSLDGGEVGMSVFFLGLFAAFLLVDLVINCRALYLAMGYNPSYRAKLDALA